MGTLHICLTELALSPALLVKTCPLDCATVVHLSAPISLTRDRISNLDVSNEDTDADLKDER